MDFKPNIALITPRLNLRYLEVEDTHDIFRNINSDPEVLRYFIDRYVEDESAFDMSDTIAFCKANKRYLFAIVRNDTNETIGLMLQCSTPDSVYNVSDVGFAIGRAHWNQGYGTEALAAMIRFLFSQGVHKVSASHIVGNDASGRVMQKCGMKYEGRSIQNVYYHNRYYDTECYYILSPLS